MRIRCLALVVALVGAWGCADNASMDEAVSDESQEGEPVIPDLPGQGNPEKEEPALAESKPEEKSDSFVVTSYSLSVRSGPGMVHPVVDYLQKGDRVQALEMTSVWVKIGEDRYVGRKHLQAQ